MTVTCTPVVPDIDTLLRSLRDLDRHLISAGMKKHDRAHALINASISEGVETGTRIVSVLAKLGFDKRHVGIMLKTGLQTMPEWPNWGCNDDGKYYAPPAPS
ncbi:MAG: hypothetical protein CL945_00265 [Dinoroseobacter sp.]|jgi:spermidine/putrescine-binding protein|nr:hypothetical protein [Dinoroseobacter sp.]|tara:strand:+ start:361 stop:666 length:306 start_codon:yes stop_codon:yes gene_type:complete